VSENDEVTAQALQKLWWMSECHGNERLKRKAFRRLRKTDMEGADVTCCGRLGDCGSP